MDPIEKMESRVISREKDSEPRLVDRALMRCEPAMACDEVEPSLLCSRTTVSKATLRRIISTLSKGIEGGELGVSVLAWRAVEVVEEVWCVTVE
jgi:hypothetical protein